VVGVRVGATVGRKISPESLNASPEKSGNENANGGGSGACGSPEGFPVDGAAVTSTAVVGVRVGATVGRGNSPGSLNVSPEKSGNENVNGGAGA